MAIKNFMILEVLRIVFGFILILFIPGYALTWAFFPRKQDITTNERLALSFVLSIPGVMLSVLFIDLVLGVDTTPMNIVLTILGLTLMAAITWKVHIFAIEKNLKQQILKGILISVKRFTETINKIKYKIKL